MPIMGGHIPIIGVISVIVEATVPAENSILAPIYYWGVSMVSGEEKDVEFFTKYIKLAARMAGFIKNKEGNCL